MTDQNKAKTRDELAREYMAAKRGFMCVEHVFIEGAKWADANPSPEVQGLLDALSYYAELRHWEGLNGYLNKEIIIGDSSGFQTKSDEVSYVGGKRAREALETYHKVTSKE